MFDLSNHALRAMYIDNLTSEIQKLEKERHPKAQVIRRFWRDYIRPNYFASDAKFDPKLWATPNYKQIKLESFQFTNNTSECLHSELKSYINANGTLSTSLRGLHLFLKTKLNNWERFTSGEYSPLPRRQTQVKNLLIRCLRVV